MTTRSVLDHSLLEIRDDILRLASLVNQATRRAMEAIATGDVGIAQEVIEGDNAIDSLHHSLEEHIVRTTALQQPMATDLRVLIAALLFDLLAGVRRELRVQVDRKLREDLPAALVSLLLAVHGAPQFP